MDIKKIAFTDFEMTGLDPCIHEIIEIGLVVADYKTLKIIGTLERKVQPNHIETALPEALAFNGYTKNLWENAVTSDKALQEYVDLAADSIFAAWNTPYDWPFLVEGLKNSNIKNPLDYHTIDIFTFAFLKLKDVPDLNTMKLSKICEYLGIEKEPMPHRAINGADRIYKVYKKLRDLP